MHKMETESAFMLEIDAVLQASHTRVIETAKVHAQHA